MKENKCNGSGTAHTSTSSGIAPFDVVQVGNKQSYTQSMEPKGTCKQIGNKKTKKEMFNSEYTLGKEIGKGSYSTVHLCTHTATGEVIACKVRICGCSIFLLVSPLLAFVDDWMICYILSAIDV